MSTRITVAHSPDSDDAFMFFGLASGAVETGGIVVDQVLSDIETLNRAAFEGSYEVTAVSFHAYAHLADKYALLPHGASMGDNYGPIVVAQGRRADRGQGQRGSRSPARSRPRISTLRLYEPDFEYVVVPFDQIQQAVLDGKAEAGLLIHEGQLTYQDEGLQKIVDLGEWWSERTGGLPLPLGGNIIRRDLGPAMIAQGLEDAARQHRARAVAPRRRRSNTRCSSAAASIARKTDRFVGMYVNDLTLSYGERGRRGLERLMGDAFERGLIPQRVPVEFAA